MIKIPNGNPVSFFNKVVTVDHTLITFSDEVYFTS